jgi:uncharacterized protein (TIGR03000 family)
MRTRWIAFGLLLAVSVLLTPAKANAQFFYNPYGGLYGPNPYTFGGGYGSGYYGGYGGGYYGGNRGMYGMGGYYGNYGYSGGMIPTFSGILPANYGYGALYSAQTLPGWMTSGSGDAPPRSRPTLSPAVPVKGSDVTPAAYGGQGAIATVEVKLPNAQAEIWFEGVQMKEVGVVREFTSPPLDPNSKYSYEIKIRWPDTSGKLQETFRSISVRAGQRAFVDFTKSAKQK